MTHARWPVRIVVGGFYIATLMATLLQIGGGAPTNPISRVVFAGVVGVYLAVGVLITERRAGNPVGLVLVVMGILTGTYLIVDAVIFRSVTGQTAAVAAWIASIMDAPLFILVSLLFLLFPDGGLPSPRWRWLLLVDLVLAGIVVTWIGLKPGPLAFYPQFDNPFGRPEAPLEAVGPTAYLLLLVSVALSALSLVGRWRRGGSLERAQLKWVASAAAFAAVVMGSYGVVIGPGAFNEVFDFLVGLALGFFPIAIGIAILRYHLFEIDRLVSRTISYALITAILVATYAAVILVLQGPLGNLLGGDTVSVALSTLVVAALFQPLRRRIQRAVDGRFDRARFDGERTSAAFSERLRHETDIAMVVSDLDSTVRSALRPTSLGLWLRPGAER